MTTTLRVLTKQDLPMVLAWRNHPAVRQWMFTRHEITPEEHIKWFESASQNTSKHLLVFELNGTPQGCINLSIDKLGKIADWGFYIAPDAVKGTGRLLGEAALRYCFEILGLHKVCGQVIQHNQKSINFHLRLGFRNEGILQQQHFDGQQFSDVYLFGMLASDWQKLRISNESNYTTHQY